MRIAHLVGAIRLPRRPDEDGYSGVARASLELARAQAQQGHEVWVVSVGSEGWHETWCGVQLIQLRIQAWAQLRVGGRQLDFSVHLPYIALTRRHTFDVIHSHMYPYLRFLRSKIRAVHFHNNPHSLSEQDLAQSVRHSDLQLGVSEFVTEQLRRRLPGKTSMHTVYNGVNLAAFGAEQLQADRQRWRDLWGLGDDDIAFLYAGAIVPQKGVLELCRAYALLSGAAPSAHLVLAGDGGLWDMTIQRHAGAQECHADVLRLLERVPQPHNVHALGRVNSAQMPGVYAACDVLVVPSHNETFSLVALEAMAAGRPVIASSVGGLPEVVLPGTGLLVPPYDASGLEAAMRELVKDAPARQTMGQQAHARAQRLTWASAAAALDTIYTQQRGG